MVRRLLSFLPQNNMEEPYAVEAQDDPNRMDEDLLLLVPVEPNKVYNMKEVIVRIVDKGDFMEVHEHFAPNLVVGFARINGDTVGIVAQQPSYLAGAIDINASDKGARFVRFCDCFNIPIVTFVDVPVTCRAPTRSLAVSSAMEPSSSMPMPRPPYRRSA